MTLLVRDEEDIIKENIEYHLSQGVDYFIVTDNNSVDNTVEVLKDFEKQGILELIHEKEDDYSQCKWVTRMARMAKLKYNADWVINSDADEFWFSESKRLKDCFYGIPENIDKVRVRRHNFVYQKDYFKKNSILNMQYRQIVSTNSLGKILPPKVAHRGSCEVCVMQGNHKVEGLNKEMLESEDVEIFHYPLRNKKHFINKIKKRGAAYEKNSELDKKIGQTWRALYSQYKQDGLIKYLHDNTYSKKRIKSELGEAIIMDTRLADYFRFIIQKL